MFCSFHVGHLTSSLPFRQMEHEEGGTVALQSDALSKLITFTGSSWGGTSHCGRDVERRLEKSLNKSSWDVQWG
ncbi:hypothetical protein CDAR_447611 [Caerostris darwini]|uniref:Uncharacterized protein n=1 Tax=Caerostris darwini TaxID=1538125 RepID=A0AAV4PSN4_9ARAC|nr:hypothetical protein CDAR_447611 [Caerostris darwini]